MRVMTPGCHEVKALHNLEACADRHATPPELFPRLWHKANEANLTVFFGRNWPNHEVTARNFLEFQTRTIAGSAEFLDLDATNNPWLKN